MPLLDRELLKRTGIVGLATGELIVYTGVGYGVGKWLEQKWDIGTFFSLVLALGGFSLAGWRIFLQSKKWLK